MNKLIKINKYILVLLCTIIFSCDVKKKLPTYNDSFYTIALHKRHTKSNNNVTINVKALNGKPLSNLTYWIKRDCENIRVDNASTYSLKVDYELLRMEVTGFGYRTIEIKPLKLNPNDSVVFDFYMVQDDRPLLECITKAVKN
ncbi:MULTISPECIES: hypothetical protein [Flavobacterium]|jgi:hypothetical protein|uniref:Lipoprotein n=1 Tax=Flavobacterium algoritolerans TaxID=3041254 RepID=A0ABT6V717_9FLAO|nr:MULTISPECIES: hypothetical protein [Flavobacterium]MDI5887000.1 hypothetical protein [Flavobacterium yafengii]MDI5894025.1 hypothetical protein [Flavobacterium algoritolerans]